MAQNPVARHLSRRYQVSLLFEGMLVGLAGGGIVTLYRLALTWAEGTLRAAVAWSAGYPLRMALWFAFITGIMLVVGRLMLWEPFTVGSGIPQVEAEVMGRVNQSWARTLVAKFVEGTLVALAGLSLGREGPSIQLGGMAGKAVSKMLKRGRGDERILITCGAASGMSAAFHAPLTGVMFTIEEIHKTFSAPLVIAVMAASIASDFLSAQVLGISPVLRFHFAQDLPHLSYFVLILMGVVMGLAGAAHNLGMFYATDLLSKIQKRAPYLRLAVPFAMAGIIAYAAPALCCGGGAIVDLLEDGNLPIMTMALLLLGKYLFTTVSFGSGAPGGTLFPLVVMGGLAGAIFGAVVTQALGLGDGYVVNFLVLGIAGLFASVVRAPVTGIVLVFELTGSFDALLSLSLVAIVSYVVANLCQADPFYEHLLDRLLGFQQNREEEEAEQDAQNVLHGHIVETSSFLEGKRVCEVIWPKNTLLVTIKRSGKDILPRASTTLHALDRILVLMDLATEDEAEERLQALCHGAYGITSHPDKARQKTMSPRERGGSS